MMQHEADRAAQSFFEASNGMTRRQFRVLTGPLLLRDRLVFLDVITDQTENVFPMVPSGAGLKEMVLR